MVIQLKELFELVGEKKDISYSIELDELPELKGYSFGSPIAISGTIVNRAGVVSLDYSVKFAMKLICDRCLCEFDREYDYAFEHILVRSTNTDNDEYVVCKANALDLNELAISDLLLQLPTKILCNEDCKGLCFRCGCNLNESQCSCAE